MGNIRRSRGYSFEHLLVRKLNNEYWTARRLGGSSTNLPDIIAVNNLESILLSVEAKSGTGDNLYVPGDQIRRCVEIKEMFSAYKSSHVILAFKFMTKRRIRVKGTLSYGSRKLREYYKIADKYIKYEFPPTIKCNYSGKTFEIIDNNTSLCRLKDYDMPFVPR